MEFVLLDRLLADLNDSMRARESLRTQALRKVVAACRMQALALGLPPTRPLPESEVRSVLQKLALDWEEEARNCERKGEHEAVRALRGEIAVLAAYLPGEDTPQHLRRHTHRVNVGPEFRVRFFLMDEPVEGVRVVNLGAGGCRLELDSEVAELLQKGTRLHNLAFCHPDLPDTPVLAEVVYLLGKTAMGRHFLGAAPKVLAGVRFLNAPEGFEEAIYACVEARCPAAGDPFRPEWQERIPRVDMEELGPAGSELGCRVHFFLMDEAFRDVPLLNLGAGGCCLMVHAELAELLKAGVRLHNFSLSHPELPREPQHAEVVYLREADPREGSSRWLSGVRFLHPKEGFQAEVSAFVRGRLAEEARFDGIRGIPRSA